VSPNGDHVVSAGSDRVIRLITKSEEPLVLEDEAEEERARDEEDELMTGPESIVKGIILTKLKYHVVMMQSLRKPPDKK